MSVNCLRLGQALSHQTALAIQLTNLAEEAKQVAIAREQEKAAQDRAAELAKANDVLRCGVKRLAETGNINAGSFLLCQLCIPLMKEAGYGRVVNMSSTTGSFADMSNPNSPYDSVLGPSYRLSKTALNAVTSLFARELRGTNILINSTCPGWVQTDMGTESAPLTVEEGADTPVWLATLPDGEPSGSFFNSRKPVAW